METRSSSFSAISYLATQHSSWRDKLRLYSTLTPSSTPTGAGNDRSYDANSSYSGFPLRRHDSSRSYDAYRYDSRSNSSGVSTPRQRTYTPQSGRGEGRQREGHYSTYSAVSPPPRSRDVSYREDDDRLSTRRYSSAVGPLDGAGARREGWTSESGRYRQSARARTPLAPDSGWVPVTPEEDDDRRMRSHTPRSGGLVSPARDEPSSSDSAARELSPPVDAAAAHPRETPPSPPRRSRRSVASTTAYEERDTVAPPPNAVSALSVGVRGGTHVPPRGWLGEFLTSMAAASPRGQTQDTAESLSTPTVARAAPDTPPAAGPPSRSSALTGAESGGLEHLHVLALEAQLQSWRQRALNAEAVSHAREDTMRRFYTEQVDRVQQHAEHIARRMVKERTSADGFASVAASPHRTPALPASARSRLLGSGQPRDDRGSAPMPSPPHPAKSSIGAGVDSPGRGAAQPAQQPLAIAAAAQPAEGELNSDAPAAAADDGSRSLPSPSAASALAPQPLPSATLPVGTREREKVESQEEVAQREGKEEANARELEQARRTIEKLQYAIVKSRREQHAARRDANSRSGAAVKTKESLADSVRQADERPAHCQEAHGSPPRGVTTAAAPVAAPATATDATAGLLHRMERSLASVAQSLADAREERAAEKRRALSPSPAEPATRGVGAAPVANTEEPDQPAAAAQPSEERARLISMLAAARGLEESNVQLRQLLTAREAAIQSLESTRLEQAAALRKARLQSQLSILLGDSSSQADQQQQQQQQQPQRVSLHHSAEPPGLDSPGIAYARRRGEAMPLGTIPPSGAGPTRHETNYAANGELVELPSTATSTRSSVASGCGSSSGSESGSGGRTGAYGRQRRPSTELRRTAASPLSHTPRYKSAFRARDHSPLLSGSAAAPPARPRQDGDKWSWAGGSPVAAAAAASGPAATSAAAAAPAPYARHSDEAALSPSPLRVPRQWENDSAGPFTSGHGAGGTDDSALRSLNSWEKKFSFLL